ncbi:phycobilisome core-membrane linker polypeptide (Lcm) [Synechococcus sp. PROS-7-1]|uniref:phycobilisome rod-core linker polypeptide n=1 Tax=Synechococcus sp. PROS-7-1 TaxID=1442556 RepID=UPI001645C5F2|nr:phycobilisome rod-core linker polypeptide [Synechococcus sp. PROS-7-1]QNI86074.1 phycobilisome core-membrane linker polypeptide (Lcm) [Synechococcus sp. PROS-7-1]
MTVTASSGSPRVSPQLYDTLPLSSVRQAEQQDRFPDGGELDSLITFFRSGNDRLEASRIIAANAESIVARAANRIFVGGTPLSFLESPLTTGEDRKVGDDTPLAADQVAFQQSVRTFTGESGTSKRGNFLTRLLDGTSGDADVRVVLPTGFNAISVAKYGPAFMRKSVRDMGWFLRYVGYALVAGDPSILSVNTRGLRDILLKNCSLTATNVALQEMRAASAQLLRELPEARRLTIDCFNVLLQELAVATPSTRQKPGSAVRQGLQLPAIYALAAESAQRFEMRPGLSGAEKAEVVKAAYRQVFERDIAKGYSQTPCRTEASQLLQGKISMREFIRALGRSKEYRTQFYGRFVNSRVVELAYRHFLGRGISSLEEFRKAFSIVSEQGLNGLVDVLVNGSEYAQTFGEETVPYLRDLGEEAQESAGWGSNRRLFRFSAPFEGAPQYVTLYASYRQPLADQHVYGGGNDPVGNQYGAIFPSSTASVATRPAPFSYDTRRLLVSNGMAQPGQMDSPQFRGSRPRKVGPRVLRLQQIATGGAAVPRRGGQPSIRNTESSTQAVIKAVYVQVLGTAGYAGERLSSEEARLENGDISLRDFVRAVARSNAFRRRYWEGLYITKAIEVMHRRLLGRPTFGRWEIDALFDTAARQGFYGLVDALINGQDYKDCFGEDTVPYERFITPADLNTRRAPALRRPIDLTAVVDLAMGRRPDPVRNDRLRTTSDVTNRNLKRQTQTVAGQWRADVGSMPASQWTALMRRRPQGTTSPEEAAKTWSRTIDSRFSRTIQQDPGKQGMQSALPLGDATGYLRRSGLPVKSSLPRNPSESELREVVDATYRQLLNRVPLESERLITSESRLRDGQIDLEGFVAEVATSEAFLERLSRMAPLRAATAATMALVGRASTPSETSRFLVVRAESGQRAAVQELLELRSKLGFEPSEVPGFRGLNSQPGVAQSTLTRTASLYSGNAGLTPPPSQAL